MGRVLMQRRENLRARHEGRRPRSLTEWDFLLGVHDETGWSLRFRDPNSGRFIDSDDRFAAPPSLRFANFRPRVWTSNRTPMKKSIPTTNAGSRSCLLLGHPSAGRVQRHRFATRRAPSVWRIPQPARPARCRRVELVAHGWPLRPASTFRTPADCACLTAATPPSSRRDSIALRKAGAGVRIGHDAGPKKRWRRRRKLSGTGRSPAIQGSNTRQDSAELFRRVVFSILIHNTDDHLRNHGFFIGERG